MRTFDNYFSANVLLARMQAAGINCYLKDEHTVTIDPLLTAAIGGIKLAVNSLQSAEAERLLTEFHVEEIQQAVCPRCKKKEIVEISVPEKNIVSTLLNKLFSKYTIPENIWYECQNCHWKSKLLSDTEIDWQNVNGEIEGSDDMVS